LRELLAARREAYAAVPWHVDTTHRSPDEVAAAVAALHRAGPAAWAVRTPTGSYPVLLGAGGLAHLGALLRVRAVDTVVVVSDEHVWPLHGPRLLAGLAGSGVTATPVVLPAGEQHKNLATVSALYDRFIDAGLTRSGAVVALGGGVITDMAGFAAATYMRGVAVVPVPTSLLSMVDAGVGGKVAVDHPRGKNLVGAFIEPLLVLLDPDVLASLPEAEYRAGLAEIIKAGVIADPELFAALEDPAAAPERGWLVRRALQVKIDVVEEDPYERGRRAVLNLGHTFAHAFEVLADYRLHHGLAVSMGMAAAAHLAEIRGRCTVETRERIISTLARHGLPVSYSARPPAEIYAAMGTDKKRRGAHLRFVLPGDIGWVLVEEAPEADVLAALERTREA
jgi:3-dehydroquinate synthase